MPFADFFDSSVIIKNKAEGGESTRTFIEENLWKPVSDSLIPGDYVFIQFGHNDEKPDSANHTDASTTFRQNLINSIEETKAKDAIPILFTSIVRRKFNATGKLEDTHGDYVTVVRELARDKGIPMIDLNKKTGELVESLGPEKSKSLYLYIQPGAFSNLPNGKQDDTHLCVYGATRVAELAVQGIKQEHLGLAKYLR
jgi:lysophospholipase L1-like esterase